MIRESFITPFSPKFEIKSFASECSTQVSFKCLRSMEPEYNRKGKRTKLPQKSFLIVEEEDFPSI